VVNTVCKGQNQLEHAKTRVTCGRKVARMRDMVHANGNPQYDVVLHETFAIEILREVDQRVFHAVIVKGTRTCEL
jgi:hypothetical protein